jgi:hypothetical protein
LEVYDEGDTECTQNSDDIDILINIPLEDQERDQKIRLTFGKEIVGMGD